jgi:hypothetical protein
VAPLGVPSPLADIQMEGMHAASWQLEASPTPIMMGTDLFCDGAVFTPDGMMSSTSG